MKDVGQPTKKADFQLKKGFQAYSRLSIVSGLFILGTVPLVIWSYLQHPEWLGGVSQSINGEDETNKTPDYFYQPFKSAKSKNDNQKEQIKTKPIKAAKEESKNTAQQDSSSTLGSQIFRQLPDQTINLGKNEKSKNPNPSPKSSPIANLFPALPKTFISPFEGRKDNNVSSNQQITTRVPTLTPLASPSAENPLNSSLRRFNNQRRTIPAPAGTAVLSKSNYPNYSNTYPGQTYTPNPYQVPPYGNGQTQQPDASNPYQVQPYGNVQTQQPYTSNPYQVQPYGNVQTQQPYNAGIQPNPYR